MQPRVSSRLANRKTRMSTRRNHDIQKLRQLDVAHHLPSQSSYQLQAEMGGSRIITSAQGCVLRDGDGKELLDGMAGLWCVNVGYGRQELVEAASAQMQELPFTVFSNVLISLIPPAGIKRSKRLQNTIPILSRKRVWIFLSNWLPA